MSAKKSPSVKAAGRTEKTTPSARPWMLAGTSTSSLESAPRAATPSPDLLLVCLQDPFEAVGDSTTITRATVPTADGAPAHQWLLESAMEMNPPRFFQGWATRGSFTLDLSVSATATPATGTWGGTARTTSGTGNCRVVIMRDATNKVRISLATAARHAVEVPMPAPEERRFLNADIAFEANGSSGLSAGAVAVISHIGWSRLLAGSSAATQGMAFDGKWRHNLDKADGDVVAPGQWAFAVMTKEAYEAFCENHGRTPYVI